MRPATRPTWQQMTALVSLSTSGVVTGFSFVPHAAADITSPASLPIHLMALEKAAQPPASGDTQLRTAIVNVAKYYLRLAEAKTPAQMEALIWQRDSLDGAGHGQSCAAFASLTLELGAHVVGQQSWVTGGTSYPWPVHPWVDARVEPNPDSPQIISIQQDAEAHQRWHPIGDGYRPLPGDWVLFPGHVEVVTSYAAGVLHTIGGDSLPDYSVNAHEYRNPLSAAGVTGFVNNGDVAGAPTVQPDSSASHPGHRDHQAGHAGLMRIPGTRAAGTPQLARGDSAGSPAVPGLAAAPRPGGAAHEPGTPREAAPPAATGPPAQTPPPASSTPPAHPPPPASATAPSSPVGTSPRAAAAQRADAAPAIPGLSSAQPHSMGGSPSGTEPAARRHTRGRPGVPGALHPAAHPRHHVSSHTSTAPGSSRGAPVAGSRPATAPPPAPPATPRPDAAQQAFIQQIAPGAIAAQHKYGVPASVTIAQAIEESGWGLSSLAVNDHNLFGIKGTGPAGRDTQPTVEYEHGQQVTRVAIFRRYHSVAQSIDDHGRLLATSGYYGTAMSHRHDPNAFAAALTGIYATDPDYGAKLIDLMSQYDLYHFDDGMLTPAPGGGGQSAAGGPAASPGAVSSPAAAPGSATASRPGPAASAATPHRQPRFPQAPPGQPDVPGLSAVSGSGPAHHRGAGTGRRVPAGRRTALPRSEAGPGSRSPGSPANSQIPASGRTPASSPGGTMHPGGAMHDGTPARHGQAPIPGLPQAIGAQRMRPWHGSPAAGAPAPARLSALTRPAADVTEQRAAMPAQRLSAAAHRQAGDLTPPHACRSKAWYSTHIPPSVRKDFAALARDPLTRSEPLYRDVAVLSGIRWELLAACDWMQCRARARYSPVHGEKLGTVNADGTVYRTKSEALEQCADDLVQLAHAVYGIDLTTGADLSVRDLANVFAAFRWGGLLMLHHTSAFEFPYSVAGLTSQHLSMRWPDIAEPNTPDKAGGRFRMPFGAVPVVLLLNYPATA